MSESKRLFGSFSKPKREEWTAAAASEINGGNPADNLRWKTEDELDFGPFYSIEDIRELTYLQQFQLNGITPETEPHQWANMPPVRADDPAKANQLALEHLQKEADGVIFYLPASFKDFPVLLKNISWEHCAVSFVGDQISGKELQQYVTARKLDISKLSGAFFSTDVIVAAAEWSKSPFRFTGLIVKSSTPVQEIVSALTAGVHAVDTLLKNGRDAAAAFGQIAFSEPIGPQLLIEISKLKALRILWFQIAQAYGAAAYKISDLHLHGRSEPFIKDKFQPQGNLLKSTMAAIAGISGGVNTLTIEPEDPEHITMNRIARNTSVILKLESQLGKVNDPFAGAYGTEVLVDKLAQEAWNKFQAGQ